MPLDHYVPQVHLKNFYSPSLNNRMLYAIKKSDLKSFTCHSQDICRVKNGNTNTYLINSREIEEILHIIEPKYNASLAILRDNVIDEECICVIAGFVACVTSCAPTVMRLQTPIIQNLLESSAIVVDKRGLLPIAPNSKSLIELLEEGVLRFNVDPKYPQAHAINSIIKRISILGNSKWEILHNSIPDNPFFTSDYPVAIEAANHKRVLNLAVQNNMIVPLAPDIAIRIMPDISLARAAPDFSFPKFTFRRRMPSRSEIVEINRLIVRCAEDMVFYRDDYEWIEKFVAKNRYYRIEAVNKRTPDTEGVLIYSQQQIVLYQPNP
jgi:hypothetical protein